MKQIKVEITSNQGAEKRTQLIIDSDSDFLDQLLDRIMESFGFVIKEEPEELTTVESDTLKEGLYVDANDGKAFYVVKPKKPITMDELKEGMKVMLRSDLVEGAFYGSYSWIKEMEKPHWVTIAHIGKYSFYVKESSTQHAYCTEMIDYIIE